MKKFRKRQEKKCPTSKERRAGLRAIDDGEPKYDVKELNILATKVHNDLVEMKGEIKGKRKRVIQALEILLDETGCGQNMIIPVP